MFHKIRATSTLSHKKTTSSNEAELLEVIASQAVHITRSCLIREGEDST
jgi:hypothetical protein